MSYKHVMGLQWASFHRCLDSEFIIKMDEDVVVDFYQLFDYLQSKQPEISANRSKHYLAGYVFRNVPPARIPSSKWFVTEDEFNGAKYPDYLSGWMYVTTPHTAASLVYASIKPNSSIFWIDDIWVTGILREMHKIPIYETFNEFFAGNSKYIHCCIKDLNTYGYKCPFIAAPNGRQPDLIIKFMDTVQRRCFRHPKHRKYNSCTNRKWPPIQVTCGGVDSNQLALSDRGSPVK